MRYDNQFGTERIEQGDGCTPVKYFREFESVYDMVYKELKKLNKAEENDFVLFK